VSCCGGSNFVPLATPDNCDRAIGTAEGLPGVTLNPILFAGTEDASALLTLERPWFSPAESPATAVLTRLSVVEENHFASFPDACYPPRNRRWGNDEINNPANWWRFIEVIAYSYDSWRYAAQRAQYHWPRLQRGRFVENTASVIPGSWGAVSDDTLYLFFSGSSTYQQLALQAAASFAGPTPCGGVKTSTFWCQSFTDLWVRTLAWDLPDRPNVICAGHSYGGVMAALFAAAIHAQTPAKDVSLITYGCPCPGDQQFSETLADINAVHIVNRGDPVASIPPAGSQFNLVGFLLNPLQSLAWRAWYPLKNRTAVDADGSYRFVSSIDADLAVLQVLTEELAAAEVPAPFAAHDQWEYTARLKLTAGV